MARLIPRALELRHKYHGEVWVFVAHGIRASDQQKSTARLCGNPLAKFTRSAIFVCMKRTNLMIDEQLLADATKVSGEKTFSATVNRALSELLRRSRAHAILDLRGSGAWTGDLAQMRGDHSARPRKKAR